VGLITTVASLSARGDRALRTTPPAAAALPCIHSRRFFTFPLYAASHRASPRLRLPETLHPTKLDQILRKAGINSLVVCGLTTAICVSQAAREAADRGFRVLIADDACTEVAPEMHAFALLTFSYSFGRVRTTDEVVNLYTCAFAARDMTAEVV
jgi:nicotinamidase-related amidase